MFETNYFGKTYTVDILDRDTVGGNQHLLLNNSINCYTGVALNDDKVGYLIYEGEVSETPITLDDNGSFFKQK